MQKWEYCAIVGIGNGSNPQGLTPRYPAVWNFTADGLRIDDLTEPDEVANTIAALGLKGWEMVESVNIASDGTYSIYFKRPIE